MDPNEYNECCTLAEYLEALKRQCRVLQFTHVPNETWTKSWSQKIKNKKKGVKKGVPDYMILFPDRLIFIEMKRVKGGTISPEQKEWVNDLNENGIPTYVCNGFDEAKKVIDKYLTT